MDIEEVKDELYRLKSDIGTGYPLRTNHQKERFVQSIDKAVKSLDMWDTVLKDLENLSENMIDGVGGSKFTVNFIIKMIKEYIEEIEE